MTRSIPYRRIIAVALKASSIRGLGYSKIVIMSDQEPAIRSMARNVVENLFEDDFRELRDCQVVMHHSPVGE